MLYKYVVQLRLWEHREERRRVERRRRRWNPRGRNGELRRRSRVARYAHFLSYPEPCRAWRAWRVYPWHASVAPSRSWSTGLCITIKLGRCCCCCFLFCIPLFGSELRVWWFPCSKSDEPIAWNKTNLRTDLKVLPYINLPSIVDGNGTQTFIFLKFSLYYYVVVTLALSYHVRCNKSTKCKV
jgi:hypothetical protein